MSTDKRCPGCRGRMQRFLAMDVELDRCRKCQGVWLDAGELPEVLQRELKPRLVGGQSTRPCATCEQPMRSARVAGGIAVETCEDCRGIFLDKGELEQLTRDTGGVGPRTARAGGDPSLLFFYCVSCAGRFPLSEGRRGEEGLVCSSCAPAAQPSATREEVPVAKVGGWLSRWFGGSD